MGLRIDHLAKRPPAITIIVDGKPLSVYPGESLAAAMLAARIYTLRCSPRFNQPRGAFCFMGVCQECLVLADSKRVLACQTSVQAGMIVNTGQPIDT